MSMSQEEIEALMNGLEVPEEDNALAEEEVVEEEAEVNTQEEVEEENHSMSEEDIAKLLSQSDDEEEAIDETEMKTTDDEESTEDTEIKNTDIKDDISEVLSEIDNMEEIDNITGDGISSEDDDILTQDELDEEPILESEDDNSEDDYEFTEKARNWTEKKITKGEFPFPAEPSTKVVSQLNEVANDSEEKAGQIFDVLSFILDENAVIQKSSKNISTFVDKEIELLNALCDKFPNIKLFEERLKEAQSMKEIIGDISSRVGAEDLKLFEAMELMQFHDINRQKIERVMSVIRKLTLYLNNLFEEDEDYEEIAIAKHIHGDSNSDLVGAEDLDSLIAEFSK